jgi:hypothetical protein
MAAIVSPENIPTTVNWTRSWPSALKICGKTERLFFNKGLVSGLIRTLNLAIAFGKAYLSSLGSKISSAKICCYCDP